MGILGRAQSGGNKADDQEHRAHVRRIQSEVQIMKDDLKKLEKEISLALREKAADVRSLSQLQTKMREEGKVLIAKEREFAILQDEIKRREKEIRN